jgi:signal transduction histidine kinase
VRRPTLSVRQRLTAAVALLAGVAAVTLAVLAPRAVERALIDDTLDADAADSAASVQASAGLLGMLGSLGSLGGLDAAVTGALAGVAEDLASTPAAGELRRRSVDGTIVVVLAPDSAVAVRGDDTVAVEQDVPGDRPVVAVTELLDLSSEVLGGMPFLEGLLLGELPFDSPGTPIGDEPRMEYGVREVDGIEYLVGAPVDDVVRSVDRIRVVLWWAVPAVVAAAGLATWVLAGRALRPVRDITEETGRIRGGRLHARVPVPATGDEIATLATTMNEMLDRLQRDDERRRRFVSDASHELRSPVAVLRSTADVALAGPADADVVELATTVRAEADRMSAMISDLLALARHDEGLPPPAAVVDLDDVVLAEASRGRALPVDVHKVSAARVRGRPDELARMVTHLLDNAVRHARSEVSVTLSVQGHDAVLVVEDDGPGVPAQRRQAVFERFVRLDDARTRDGGGAGLGLAVVAATARGAGGSAEVTDSPLGGARFVVSLPAAD